VPSACRIAGLLPCIRAHVDSRDWCAGTRAGGTTTTPFDMCVRNQLDRFNLVNDVINRVPKLGARAAYAQQAIREKLLDHESYIAQYGDDMPEIRNWQWGGADAAKSTKADTAADNV